MRNLDVLVGIPSSGTWTEGFGMSLMRMLADFTVPFEGYEDQNINCWSAVDSILPRSRHRILRYAIETNRSHLLFIDTDQEFPPYTLRKLVSWQKPIVACNIPVKRFPSTPTARRRDPKSDQGRVVYSIGAAKELEQVWRVGTGVMLIEIDAVKKIPPPWFSIKYKPATGDYQGEDWGFCDLLDQYNIPIYVDNQLSCDVAHIGKVSFTHEMCVAPDQMPLDALEATRR